MPATEDDIATPKVWDPKKSLAVIVSCMGLGLAIVVFQALHVGAWGAFVAQAAIMLAISGAAIMVGGLVGFLFGIPRRLQNDDNGKKSATEGGETEPNERVLYEGNTNLEQISDWLTKIIVGVTLVKLSDIVTELSKYGAGVATATGRPADAAFAIGLMIFFFIGGFLTGYLWSRLFLGRALTEAESRIRLQKKLDKLQQQAQSDADAIAFARRQLSSGSSRSQTVDDIEQILTKTSSETLSHVFSLAENNRWRNWESNKEQMERSILIFEALIRLDKQGRYHRNLGQLAYCLKDKTSPDWPEAERLFTRAIKSRGDASTNGLAAYEANRAIVRIVLGDKIRQNFGSVEEMNSAIEADLRIALQDYWVAEWLRKDQHVASWAEKNHRQDLLQKSD